MRWVRATLGVAAATMLWAATSTAVMAQTISPSSYSRTIAVGESFTLVKTITLPAAATSVDLFFLIDNTGSMGGTIDVAKAGATAIMNALPTGYQFGAGSYLGDLSEGMGEVPYTERQGLTSNKSAVQAGIDAMSAGGGWDTPEANFYALKQVADGQAWRSEAQRLIAWFGDAPSHTATTTEAQAIAALQGANAKVIGFNAGGPGGGMDSYNQVQGIVGGAGGAQVNYFTGLSSAEFVSAVLGQISSVTSNFDLNFFSTFVGTGLDIAFTCIDAGGCDDVAGGSSRQFQMTVKGLAPGTYDFSVGVRGVEALETDHIVVTDGGTATPEPITMLLIGSGLAGIGAARRRRKVA